MTWPDSDAPVLVERRGRIGHLTLNRPAALNAVTLDMVRIMAGALDEWECDDEVHEVVLVGAGERGLCAGGDIRAIYDAALIGDRSPAQFWVEEYRLNGRIGNFAKPFVALMDGIVMGGGVGVSGHGRCRVVTERSVVAMPEVGIGFAPDVGGTWLLSRAPGELGTHLGLTADRMTGADAKVAGMADHLVASGDLDAFVAACASEGHVAAVARFALDPADEPPSALAASRPWIDACYAADSVEEILERLDRHAVDAPTSGAADAAAALRRNSPTSLKVTLRALRQARELPTLARCLDEELRISCAFLDTPDLVEGVRAAIVDKDRNPTWSPARLDQVADEDLDRFFVRPAWLPGPA